MRADILATILEDAGLGVIGETIFIHHMPDACAEGVLIRLPLIGIPIDHELPGYIKGRVQVIVRATAQSAGDALASEVMKALTIYATEYLDPETGVFAMKINYLRADTLPIVYPRSVGNLKEWSINFDCCHVLAVS